MKQISYKKTATNEFKNELHDALRRAKPCSSDDGDLPQALDDILFSYIEDFATNGDICSIKDYKLLEDVRVIRDTLRSVAESEKEINFTSDELDIKKIISGLRIAIALSEATTEPITAMDISKSLKSLIYSVETGGGSVDSETDVSDTQLFSNIRMVSDFFCLVTDKGKAIPALNELLNNLGDIMQIAKDMDEIIFEVLHVHVLHESGITPEVGRSLIIARFIRDYFSSL